MAKITVFQRAASGALPYHFKPASEEEIAQLGPLEISPAEKRKLIETGIWLADDEPGADKNWTQYGAGGEVWAGNSLKEGPRAPIAKVRAKGGRRVAARLPKVRDDERMKTLSFQTTDAKRQALEAIASERTEAAGRRITLSAIVNEAVDTYLSMQREALDNQN